MKPFIAGKGQSKPAPCRRSAARTRRRRLGAERLEPRVLLATVAQVDDVSNCPPIVIDAIDPIVGIVQDTIRCPPVVELGDATATTEGSAFTTLGSFVDPDPDESWTATVDYGDGSGQQALPLSPNNTFVLRHAYRDDGQFTVRVVVTDSRGLEGTATLPVVVSNVPPQNLVLSGPASGVKGQLLTFEASFTDPGLDDVHTAKIDWGDGTTSDATIIPNGAGAWRATASHAYRVAGLHRIVLTVADDDGGSASQTVQVQIAGVALDRGVLQVIGSPQRDVLTIGQSAGKVLVGGSLGGQTVITAFRRGCVQRIVAYLGDGNDRLTITRTVRVPALIDGGNGNDTLTANGSAAILIGGDGDDVLTGGRGRDVLIGGAGRDRLAGRAESDLLIPDATIYDQNEAALWAIQQQWLAKATLQERIENLRAGKASALAADSVKLTAEAVLDDQAVDTIFGELGLDWNFADSR